MRMSVTETFYDVLGERIAQMDVSVLMQVTAPSRLLCTGNLGILAIFLFSLSLLLMRLIWQN